MEQPRSVVVVVVVVAPVKLVGLLHLESRLLHRSPSSSAALSWKDPSCSYQLFDPELPCQSLSLAVQLGLAGSLVALVVAVAAEIAAYSSIVDWLEK